MQRQVKVSYLLSLRLRWETTLQLSCTQPSAETTHNILQHWPSLLHPTLCDEGDCTMCLPVLWTVVDARAR